MSVVRRLARAGRARVEVGATRFVRSTRRATVRLVRSEDLTYASSIAYYALVSLFPLLLFAAALLGRLTSSETERQAVVDFILEFFPEQIELVRAQLDAVGQASLGLTVASSLVIVPVALGVFRSISAAVNHAWEAAAPPGFLRNQIVAFLMLGAADVLLTLALIWVSLAGVVRTNLFAEVLAVVPALDAIAGVSGKLPATAAVTLVAGLLYYFVPNTRVRFRDVWVGAVLTGLLWHAALAAFSWYLREWADLTIHGSIATVVTFLLWVYICAVIFLYGVEFTAAWVWFGARDRATSAAA